MYLASSSSIFVGVFAALVSMVIFGLGDFGGGELGKKINPFTFLAAIYTIEIPLLFMAMVFTSSYGLLYNNLWLFSIGIIGTIGYGAIIFGLTRGYVSIVMPLAGLVALVVPAVASILIGETTSYLVWVGIAIAIVAIIFVTRVTEPDHHESKKEHRIMARFSIAMGVVAGLATGIYFVGLDQIDSPIIPKLFYLQLFGFIAGIYYLAVNRKSRTNFRKYFFLIAALAVAYQLGQMLFPFASEKTSLAVTNVLVNLYPAVTIAMAKIINKEQTNQIQNIGFVFALVGVVCVSIGASI